MYLIIFTYAKWLHQAFHIDGHWMEQYAWFHEMRMNHFEHHLNAIDVNYGFLDFSITSTASTLDCVVVRVVLLYGKVFRECHAHLIESTEGLTKLCCIISCNCRLRERLLLWRTWTCRGWKISYPFHWVRAHRAFATILGGRSDTSKASLEYIL